MGLVTSKSYQSVREFTCPKFVGGNLKHKTHAWIYFPAQRTGEYFFQPIQKGNIEIHVCYVGIFDPKITIFMALCFSLFNGFVGRLFRLSQTDCLHPNINYPFYPIFLVKTCSLSSPMNTTYCLVYMIYPLKYIEQLFLDECSLYSRTTMQVHPKNSLVLL